MGSIRPIDFSTKFPRPGVVRVPIFRFQGLATKLLRFHLDLFEIKMSETTIIVYDRSRNETRSGRGDSDFFTDKVCLSNEAPLKVTESWPTG